MFRRRLRHKEHAFDIQVHHVVPVALAEVNRVFTADQPGIIDQNIDMTEFRHGAIQQVRNGVDFTQVRGQAQETAAQRGHALDGFRRLDDVDAHDIAARFCQPQRHAWPRPVSQPETTATLPCRENASRIMFVPYSFDACQQQADLCLTARD